MRQVLHSLASRSGASSATRSKSGLPTRMDMVAGILCLGYLSITLGKIEVLGKRGYQVYAIFSDVGGLRSGAPLVVG